MVSTVLCILIASLGLLALTILVLKARVKEISNRKVMGASPFTIFRLLARGFFVQLVIAIVMSISITYWLISRWLEEFAYSISIEADMFLLSGVIAFTLAFLVISYHAMKVATANPVDSIRVE